MRRQALGDWTLATLIAALVLWGLPAAFDAYLAPSIQEP